MMPSKPGHRVVAGRAEALAAGHPDVDAVDALDVGDAVVHRLPASRAVHTSGGSVRCVSTSMTRVAVEQVGGHGGHDGRRLRDQSSGTRRTSCAVASGSLNRTMRRPSAVDRRRARLVSGVWCTTRVAAPGASVVLDHPRAGHEAVDEDACPSPCARRSPSRARCSSDPNRVRSACERSTLSYSGRKRGGAGTSASGSGASGHVVQHPATLVAEGAQARPEALDHLARAPVSRDHAATSAIDGRPEGGEVAQHDLVDRRARSSGRGPSTPRAWWRAPCPSVPTRRAAAPARARGGSGTRTRAARASRSGNRSASAARSSVGVSGRFVEQRSRDRQDGREIDRAQHRREVAVHGELAVEHRLGERAQHDGVVGGDEVDGAAHHHDAHDGPVEHELGERRPDRTGRAATTGRGTGRAGPVPACRRGAAPSRAGS